MKLEKWMRENRWSDAKFIDKINELLVADGLPPIAARSVANWRKGICLPRIQATEAIEKFTAGAVAYADHAAAVKDAKT